MLVNIITLTTLIALSIIASNELVFFFIVVGGFFK